ncbi:MAG TPA: hypothetical protein ENI60_05020 [Candidatus Fraserbacteria bacterium]|nr:hypothetical protein [Candidatus Fraserbacteria bacterium]
MGKLKSMSVFVRLNIGARSRYSLSLLYFLTAAVDFLVWIITPLFDGRVVTAPFLDDAVLGWVHLATLGWITMTIMGATFQLVPVLGGAKLYSERLGYWQYAFYLPGMILLTHGFWLHDPAWLMLGGMLLALAILLYVYNLLRTFLRIKQWNVVAVHIATALGYLLGVLAFGLLLVINRQNPELLGAGRLELLAAHAHLALVGWVSLTIFGVSYQLISMFAPAQGYSKRLSWWAYGTLNAGIIALTAGLVGGWAGLGRTGGLLLAAAALIYGAQIAEILRHHSETVKLAINIPYTLSAIFFLYGAIGLGLARLWGVRVPWSVYGLLILGGWIALTIVGQLQRILPFLTWLKRYQRPRPVKIGGRRTPTLDQTINRSWGWAGLACFNVGLFTAGTGLWLGLNALVTAGMTLYLLGALAFAANLIKLWRGA